MSSHFSPRSPNPKYLMMIDNDQIMKIMPRATSREPFEYYVAEFFIKSGGKGGTSEFGILFFDKSSF